MGLTSDTDFVAQIADGDIKNVVITVPGATPDRMQHLEAWQNLIRVLEEINQQVSLFDGEFDRLISTSVLMPKEVVREIGIRERAAMGAGGRAAST